MKFRIIQQGLGIGQRPMYQLQRLGFVLDDEDTGMMKATAARLIAYDDWKHRKQKEPSWHARLPKRP